MGYCIIAFTQLDSTLSFSKMCSPIGLSDSDSKAPVLLLVKYVSNTLHKNVNLKAVALGNFGKIAHDLIGLITFDHF